MATPASIIDQKLPTIALVGRVNVGKSTLFNRLVGRNHAIISDIAGTTRTRNVGLSTWRGKQFRVIDTGGLTFDESVPLEEEIVEQSEIAISEADIILFIVDLQSELLPQEKELARKLSKKNKGKPIIFVGNKADSEKQRLNVFDKDWLKLGLGKPIAISAQTGSNVGDLLDFVFKNMQKLPKRPKIVKDLNPIKVAIVGRPKVGKSSLFNKLIGENRVIVSDMPHTTREPHDTLVEYEKQPILFVDTAGIRRKTKVSGLLERMGIGKSIEMIRRSDIVLLVLDASDSIADQDQQLAGLLREQTRSVIIIINKWDTAEENDDAFRNEVKKMIYLSFPHLDYAPIIFTSAKNGYRVHQIFPLILRAWKERQIEIPAEELREFIKTAVKKHLPSRGKGVHHPKILGFNQLGSNPPIFDLLIKAKTSVHFSYVHYLANRLREKYSFFATPIIIKLSKMKK